MTTQLQVLPIPPLNSVKATCKLINRGTSRTYELISSGVLEAVKDGKSTSVKGDSIIRFINSLPDWTPGEQVGS